MCLWSVYTTQAVGFLCIVAVKSGALTCKRSC